MKKNILFQFIILLLILTVSITLISLYNLRTVAVKSSIHNAETISEIVKNGLTSHMVNEKTQELDEFFKIVNNIPNVNDIWLVRNESINEQFNKTNYKTPKDEIDKKVLQTGKRVYDLQEDFTKTTLRVTVPYKSFSHKGITCTNCHNVNKGETLGALTVVLDVSTLKEIGLKSIYIIFSITLISVILLFFFTRKIINPYFTLYKKLKDNINEAKLGKFNSIAVPSGLTEEIKYITKDYNNLIEIFKVTSTDIDKKLQGFVGYKTNNKNPLKESKEIIDNLSNLYQFKKQVEMDNTKEEIYFRISEVFQNKFNLKNFTFFEIDIKKQKMHKIISVGESLYCHENIKNNPELCRASRTKSDVLSIDFHNSCPYFNKEDKFYYCIDVNVTKDYNIIINLVVDTKEELEEIKNKSPFIKRYLDEATPSIEVKLLMDALQESAYTDGLTGLYNRKFLEQNLKTLLPQVKRDEKNLALLMLDMDHFKAVNDEYGHDIGDKVLKELSRILQENVRESDILVRYGGEEFIVLLVGVNSEEDAINIAEKIGTKVRENEIDVYAGTTIQKTVSIGLSMYPQDSSSFDNVIKNADIALYEAKSTGRDKVVRFQKEQVTSVELF